MITVDYYTKRIRANQRTFYKMVNAIEKGRSLAERCLRAQEAASFAVNHTVDIFASAEVEKPFLELAESLHVPLAQTYRSGSVLHVLTEAYTNGGHTRCVERWISRMPHQEHSCMVMRQKSPFPSKLREMVALSGGQSLFADRQQNIVQRAAELRRLASRFEYIVLHLHMDDPTALIAFGSKEFKRPVVLFNHADHAFWLGVSVADWVADLSEHGNKLTQSRRCVQKSSVLGIPLDDSKTLLLPQTEARAQLGIPQKDLIIYSGGHERKYLPIGSPNFYDIICDLISCEPELHFYIAGVGSKGSFWPVLKKKFPGNVHLYGYLDYATEYPLYLAAADLVIDSYPVDGGTAVMDAVRAGKPVLGYDAVLQMDYFVQSKGMCSTYDEFIKKALRILREPAYAKEIHADIETRLLRDTSAERWRTRCCHMLEQMPAEHSVYSFSSLPPAQEISPFSLRYCRWIESHMASSLFKHIRKSIFQFCWHKDLKQLGFFGIPLIKIRRNPFKSAKKLSGQPLCGSGDS